MPTLVIVESPAKSKTIQKYLDSVWPKKYIVQSCVGHICDLPEKNLGFNPSNFQAIYEIPKDKIKKVRELKAQLRECGGDVILATDNDREGEAIAAHLRRELNLANPDRIVFNEITKAALEQAVKSPRKILENKVQSQETRRIVDRMIGWIVSPLARTYIDGNSSAGRVQTVVLLILKNLEDAIKGFKSVRHYDVSMMMLNNDVNPSSIWQAKWDFKPWLDNGSKIWIDRQVADKISTIKELVVDSIEKEEALLNPSAPFITSTLQRAAEINLNLTPKQTMDAAQQLYNAGLISYMRTDNPNLSQDTFRALKAYAQTVDLKVESELRTFKTKKSAQESHEGIRPTSFALLHVGEGVLQQVYELIWNRTVASQMPAAKFDVIEVSFNALVDIGQGGVTVEKVASFKSKARKMTYGGWKNLTKNDFSEDEDEDESEDHSIGDIPSSLKVGDVIQVKDSTISEKNTQPPRRFSSAALVKELENLGIGRPSTYASLTELIHKKGYIKYEKKRIFLTDLGYKIVENMEPNFSFIDIQFTAEMEDMLDEIENGVVDWKPALKKMWDDLGLEVKSFEKDILDKLPQHPCGVCGSLLLQIKNKDYAYWKCRNKQCGSVYTDFNDKPNVLKVQQKTDFDCRECEGSLVYIKTAYGEDIREYYRCDRASDEINPCLARYDILKVADSVQPDFDKYMEDTKHKCLECQRPILRRTVNKDGVVAHYWSCTGYRKEKPLCVARYSDLNGSPDYEKYKLNHTYNCPVCNGYLSRYKRRDNDTSFWYCGNKVKRKVCETYLEDVNTSPDFDTFNKEYIQNHTHKCFSETCDGFYKKITKKDNAGIVWRCQSCLEYCEDKEGAPDQDYYKKNHTHKCVACDSYLRLGNTSIGQKNVWRCSDKECCLVYQDIDLKPDFDEVKKKLTHKCNKCKKGYLLSFVSPRSKNTIWACSNYDSCAVRYADLDGSPNLKKVLE